MKNRFRLFKRNNTYYCQDTDTGKQTSLRTKDRVAAGRLIHAKNEALLQPALNLQIARAYLTAADADYASRTWQCVMDEALTLKKDATRTRWIRACKDRAFDFIRDRPLIETRSQHLLESLRRGTVSTNIFLRRMHNLALDMDWLPRPIIPKRRWPPIEFKPKRAITFEEHQRIIAREKNAERRNFYELAWHIGASQGDLANLTAEDIDWRDQVICFHRRKTKGRNLPPVQFSFGPETEALLRRLPSQGRLFPYLCTVRAGDRATEFRQRCQGLGIEGVTLHSYRYAWAERAKKAGYPERWAQAALGHNSRAVHHGYAKRVEVTCPSLEEFEKRELAKKVVSLKFSGGS